MRVPTLLTIAAACLTVSAAVATSAGAAPGPEARFIITVSGQYDSRDVAREHRGRGVDVDFVYTAALNGFAGAMSDVQLGELRRDRRVTRIERDSVVTASATQSGATWGLDRVDARAGTDGTYSYSATGAGVEAYIVDTGIKRGHVEFGERLAKGYDAVTVGGTADDCNGHGTHVAGTVGGTAYGVAKEVTLIPVRVLDCAGSGSWSGVIAGLDWVAANASGPAVANMSLGGGASTSVDDAVERTISSGVTVVVAAGNGDRAGRAQDACNYSPARVPAAVTIGATTTSDAKTSWSNYGSCVDLFAPGADITSAWYTSSTATNTISGTSMAAPHVAGVAALHLETSPGASPTEVRDAVYAGSTKGIVTSSQTANNHLLYSLLTAAPDDGGTVTDPAADIALTATPTKVKGVKAAELRWTGATGTSVLVHVDTAKPVTTANDGAERHVIGGKGGGSHTVWICEVPTEGACSEKVTVTF